MELKYHPSFDKKIVSNWKYLQQIVVLLFSKPQAIFLGNNERFLLRLTIKIAEIKSDRFSCKSWKIGYNLKFFKKPVFLSFTQKAVTTKKVTINNYQNLMWTRLLTRRNYK